MDYLWKHLSPREWFLLWKIPIQVSHVAAFSKIAHGGGEAGGGEVQAISTSKTNQRVGSKDSLPFPDLGSTWGLLLENAGVTGSTIGNSLGAGSTPCLAKHFWILETALGRGDV